MPKNIVLLSDGTGNSSGKLLKTNVWRVYESLDLDDPAEQVACYDDGVGTSSFKPLALLGGAFGIGLKKNVLRLYRFLCEHYDPGDRIYAFGFSRGAFTIRVLTGLICSQGIIKTRPTSPVAAAYPTGNPAAAAAAAYAVATVLRSEPQVFGRELARRARWAYREFRRNEFDQTGLLVTIARNVRDIAIRLWERRAPQYDAGDNHVVDEITFLGLWDTVDAYGLPMDELTDGINQWVWPLSAPDLRLSKKVQKACHVLAIDDERNTFHPVLWDESDEPQDAERIDDERVSQVWFAGMHANVGGGYSDDALSYLSLRWITSEADKRGVRFVPELLTHHTKKADPFGRIYDSRSGLKGYYRYNPRRIEWLTNGQMHEAGFGGWPTPSPTVTVRRPKIHESVFARIAAAPEAYAPIIFPEHYGIVREDGTIIEGPGNPYETPGARAIRVQAQERAWNLVWWKRMLYFATVTVSAVLVIRPLGADPVPMTAADHTVLSRAFAIIGDNLPALARPWVAYYSARPIEFTVLAAIIIGLGIISSQVQARICSRMRHIWSQVIPPPGRLEQIHAPVDPLFRLRSHPYYQGAFAVLRRKLLPLVFGIGTLVTVTLSVLAIANRIVFEIPNGLGTLCGPVATARALPGTVPFPSSSFCHSTGISVDAGKRYRVQLHLPAPGTWTDGDIPVGSTAGFHVLSPDLRFRERVLFAAFTPFRRMWSVNWFVPVARIGESGFDQYPLTATENEFTARSSGQLYLFVNDAILPIGVSPFGLGFDAYYPNNHGEATATISLLP